MRGPSHAGPLKGSAWVYKSTEGRLPGSDVPSAHACGKCVI